MIASAIYQKRAFPIFGILLSKKGASNLREQQIVLRPVIKLFKAHQRVVVGDREFHSVDLAEWIDHQGVKFVLRQKKDTNFRRSGRNFNSLSSVQIAPGQRKFFSEINTKKNGLVGLTGLSIGEGNIKINKRKTLGIS